jgi:hypothetical protein
VDNAPHDDTLGDSAVEGAVAALGGAVSAWHPDLAVPMAGMVVAANTLVPRLLQRAGLFRRGQVAKAVAAGAVSAQAQPETLIEAAEQTPFRQLLTADMVEAASRSAYDDKVTALGQAWAHGIMTDDEAALAIEAQFVRTVARIELPHVRVLDVVSRTHFKESDVKNPLVDGWEASAVAQKLPEFSPVVGQFLATLSAEGLIADNSIQNPLVAGTQFRITAAGCELLRRLAEAADSSSVS